MRIALISDASCIHTVRWANAYHERGVDFKVFTIHPRHSEMVDGIEVEVLPIRSRLSYITHWPWLRRAVKSFSPSITHVHCASSYGTLARMALGEVDFLSVWGSDVYDFPRKSPLHQWVVRRNLYATGEVLSTSNVMAHHTLKQFSLKTKPSVIPFGVDVERFSPGGCKTSRLTIGTIKTLAPKYGIDILLKGYSLFHKAHNELGGKSRLVIAGDGPSRNDLEKLAMDLGLADYVSFVGKVPHSRVPELLRSFDVFCAMSRLDSESFGVAVIEASSCGLPVIVSNVGGLPEVVESERTGIVIPKESPECLSQALIRLAGDPEMRSSMGRCGRLLVKDRYEWTKNVSEMITKYELLESGRCHRYRIDSRVA